MSRLLVIVGLIAIGCFPVDAQAQNDSVLSLTEYASIKHPDPYILRLCTKSTQLEYFGADHTRDYAAPLIDRLLRSIDEFRPELILVEGPLVEPEPTLSASVKKYGESGALQFEARRRHIKVSSLDIPTRDQMELTSKQYGAQLSATFYGLRIVAQEFSRDSTVNRLDVLEQKVLPWLVRNGALESPVGTNDFLRSAIGLLPLGSTWTDATPKWFDPLRYDGGRFNDVARFLVHERDQQMMNVVSSSASEGGRILAVAGVSHVVMQRNQLLSRMACGGGRETYDKSPDQYQCAKECVVN